MSSIGAASSLALTMVLGDDKLWPGEDYAEVERSLQSSEGEGATSLYDTLAMVLEDYKYGLGKNTIVVRSSSAVVSLASSLLLVWIIFKSRNGFSTTYHRLLTGMSCADILFSLGAATFGAVVPAELSYGVWNASGNMASCQTFGIFYSLGFGSTLLYSCSLNIFYLAQIKYNKPDFYIKKKLEPWLHAVPIVVALIITITRVSTRGINASFAGYCGPGAYNPPHCRGVAKGDSPDGFDIPCARGQSGQRNTFSGVAGLVNLFLPPVVNGAALWMIYRTVLRQEQRISQYGAGALNPHRFSQQQANATTTTSTTTDESEAGRRDSRRYSISSAISSFSAMTTRSLRRRSSASQGGSDGSSQSRAVAHRAYAYCLSYFLTWCWPIVLFSVALSGKWPPPPQPKWATALTYLTAAFNPLQGLWTFLIYMHPKVASVKRGGDMGWVRAFGEAVWSAVTGRKVARQSQKPRKKPNTSGASATRLSGSKVTLEASDMTGMTNDKDSRYSISSSALNSTGPGGLKGSNQTGDKADNQSGICSNVSSAGHQVSFASMDLEGEKNSTGTESNGEKKLVDAEDEEKGEAVIQDEEPKRRVINVSTGGDDEEEKTEIQAPDE